jgi:Mg2+ and Co2+ transporter CorA
MRSIAVVGLIYLPATFVSGIFGTNFFDFGKDNGEKGWSVSEEFWLYWAIAVPLTVATVGVWTVLGHGEGVWRWMKEGWRNVRGVAEKGGV